jgi:hypothetical protein
MSFFLYWVITKGPPPTNGWPFSGTLAKVFSSLPLPVAYRCHTCGGRIGVSPRSNSAVPEGRSYVATRVLGSVAVTLFRNVTLPAQELVGPLAYCLIMLKVQAASSAVRACPSDHFASGTVSNVTVRPSGDWFQFVAKLAM